jgi:hypothetical protein
MKGKRMTYTMRQFNAAITAMVEKAALVPPELQGLAEDEIRDLVARITVAAGFLMRPHDLPDDCFAAAAISEEHSLLQLAAQIEKAEP